MGRQLLALTLWLASAAPGPGPGSTGAIEGTVHLSARPDGAAPDASQPFVAYLVGFEQPPPADVPVIAQKQKTFSPNLRVLVAGQSLRFTNDDPFVHNVFSTSKARAFDLGKPSPGQTREVKFATPGLVEVFCNIHEAMWASILVLPNRAFAIADTAGHFRIDHASPGHHPLYIWSRQAEPFQTEVVVTSGKTTTVDVTLHPRLFNPAHLNKFGQQYRALPGYRP